MLSWNTFFLITLPTSFTEGIIHFANMNKAYALRSHINDAVNIERCFEVELCTVGDVRSDQFQQSDSYLAWSICDALVFWPFKWNRMWKTKSGQFSFWNVFVESCFETRLLGLVQFKVKELKTKTPSNSLCTFIHLYIDSARVQVEHNDAMQLPLLFYTRCLSRRYSADFWCVYWAFAIWAVRKRCERFGQCSQ